MVNSSHAGKSLEVERAVLVAVVLTLKPVERSYLPISHGTFAYAAALELFLRRNESLARRLHQSQLQKPLTVSPLMGVSERDGNTYVLCPDSVYSWRLTGLSEEVSQHLCQFNTDMGGVRIGNAIFSITHVAKTLKEHPDAAQETYEALWEKWGKSNPPRTITFHFLTPTTFRIGRFELPFPSPSLVFNSLLLTWDHFSPYPIGQIKDLTESCIILTNWKGETRRVEMGAHKTVGFIGKFTYRVVEDSQEFRRLIGLLAEFSFYAGVGWQTTHGLGQVRCIGIS